MGKTIQCPSISQPSNKFLCEVVRPASQMRYHDPSNGNWTPIRGERVEKWTVLAENLIGAKKVAEYHFFASKIIKVDQLKTPCP